MSDGKSKKLEETLAFNTRVIALIKENGTINTGKLRVSEAVPAGTLSPYNGTPTSKTASRVNTGKASQSGINAGTSNPTTATASEPAFNLDVKQIQQQKKKKAKQQAITARQIADKARYDANMLYTAHKDSKTTQARENYIKKSEEQRQLEKIASNAELALNLATKDIAAAAEKTAVAKAAKVEAEKKAALAPAASKGGRRKRRTYKHRKHSRGCKHRSRRYKRSNKRSTRRH